MSKAKDAINDLRSKVFDKRKEETVKRAEEKLEEQKLDQTAYVIVQDPNTKSRTFMAVILKFDLKTMTAKIEDARPFYDKTAGLGMSIDNENRKYLFEKNRGNKL